MFHRMLTGFVVAILVLNGAPKAGAEFYYYYVGEKRPLTLDLGRVAFLQKAKADRVNAFLS